MSKFFEGFSWKRVAILGASGGLFYGASDYWVDQWFEDETDTKKQGRYRALSQAAMGIAVGYLLRKWNRDVALGVALGGIVGGAKRLWVTEGMPARMSDWFRSRDANGIDAGAPVRQINQPRENVVFYDPPRRVRRAA